MRLHLNVQPMRFADAQVGTCFRFQLGGEEFIAMKAIDRADGDPDHFGIALSPGHPDLPGQPGILDLAVFRAPVLAYAHAVFVPAPESLLQGPPNQDTAGQLVWIEGRCLLMAHSGTGMMLVDIASGETVRARIANAQAHCSAWRIVHPDMDGKHVTVCTWPAGE